MRPSQVAAATLPCAAGTVLRLREGVGLVWIKDLNGNVLRFGPGGIRTYGPNGAELRSVGFVRDARGFITRVVDARGNGVTYGINASGDLARVTDRVNQSTHFTYDARHYLESVKDPRGITGLRTDYDEEGRLIATRDARWKPGQPGHKVTTEHNLAAKTETIRDRMGHVTQMGYDSFGNVTQSRRQLLDARGNLVRWITTDTAYADAGNPDRPTSKTRYVQDADGARRALTTRMAYDSEGNLIKVTDPNNRTTETRYENGRVLWVKDAQGKVAVTNSYAARAT